MFIGHYAVAFACKKLDKDASLGTYFVAAQLVDIFWATFVLLGLEKVRISPGFTESNPLDLYYMPYTHSLVATFVWAALAALVVALIYKGQRKTLWLIPITVASHFFLDALVHVPDLPLLGDSSPKLGLGLWRDLPAALTLELLLFIAGVWFYARNETRIRARRRLWIFVGFLGVFLISSFFSGAPPNTTAVGIMSLTMYFVLAAWARWADQVNLTER
jgi:hypothetical protein